MLSKFEITKLDAGPKEVIEEEKSEFDLDQNN